MNKTLRNVLIAVAVVVAVVLVLPFVVPLDSYRGRIEDAATQATGRSLRIEGPLRLTVFPQFGLRADQVTFANMPGGRASAMATVGDIRLAIKVVPLLTGHIQVAQITLDHPVIALEVDAQGRQNWVFPAGKEKTGRKSSVSLPSDTQFSGIKISDGTIRYDNAKTNTHRALDHINANIGLTRIDHPVTIDGNLTEAGRQVDFAGRVVTIQSLLSNATTGFDLSFTSDMLQASVKGLLHPDGVLDGNLKFDTNDFRGVAAWLGEALPAGGGFGRVSLDGHLAAKNKIYTLSPMHLTVDRQVMTGNLSVDTNETVPVVDAALTIDRLDLNPYLAAPVRGAPGPSPAGWSTSPLNLALLKRVDGRLLLNVGWLRMRQLTLGRTTLKATLAGGLLNARLDPIALYGGTGQAQIDVDARGAVPRFHNALHFDRVMLRPVLSDTIGVESIDATGALMLDVTAQGYNADSVMHSLAGKGMVVASHGHIRGVDLGRVASTIRTMLGGDATGEVARTDFDDMGGSFVIANGVLTTQDFHLTGPVVQMTGGGTIDVGGRSIDFRVVPKAVVRGTSVGFPFRISGSWDQVHYRPDMGAIVGGVMKNLENEGAALFGGSKDGNKKKKSVGDTLKDLFGRH